jgi:kynureninase
MMNPSPSLQDCQVLDQQDPLRQLRDQFDLPDGVIYLDGNSLGVLPRATPERVAQAVTQEWGQDLIKSWNSAGWFTLPQRVGDKIARVIGAGAGEVVAADSTSINLYKVLSAALHIADADAPQKKKIVSERSNFPTDLYIAEALCKERGYTLQLVEPEDIGAALQGDVAVLMLTHVNYRTGAMHDMAALTAQAHAQGTLTRCRAGGLARRPGRLCGGLRLQIPQRRPWRTRFRVGQPAPHRPLLATAGGLVGPCGAV